MIDPVINKLARDIARVTFDAALDDEVEPAKSFKALRIVFTVWMSCLCEDCRRNVARELMAEIPVMLESANRTNNGNSLCH